MHTSLPTVRESTPIQNKHLPPPPPVRAPHRLTTRTNEDLQNNLQRNNPKLAIRNFPNPTYSSNHIHNLQTNQTHSLLPQESWRDYYSQNGGNYYPRMRHDSGSSLRSNDDGGSTTTSGSYTLEDNDIEIVDMYPKQRDLVV